MKEPLPEFSRLICTTPAAYKNTMEGWEVYHFTQYFFEKIARTAVMT